MLSKFYHDNDVSTNRADTLEVSALNQMIGKIYPGKTVAVEKIFPGGTLNLFYRAVVDGKQFFIKTHMDNPMNRLNLQKEIEIMRTLYEHILDIHAFSITCKDTPKEFLMMDYIDLQNDAYPLDFVQNLIKSYRIRLADFPTDRVNYDVDDLYQASYQSYEILGASGLLSADVGLCCKKTLNRLPTYKNREPILCHGDLSNANMMCWKDTMLVLDWEDALLAYPEYDILYWLTFYSQRKYYSSHLFDDIGINEQYGKDIMLMILLTKCYLSYRNKSYLKNRLSINARLAEIIYM